MYGDKILTSVVGMKSPTMAIPAVTDLGCTPKNSMKIKEPENHPSEKRTRWWLLSDVSYFHLFGEDFQCFD